MDTKYHLIANIPQSLLDTIAKSEYSTHFSKEISYWKKTLSKIGDVTREWIAVQEMWTDLSKAFAIKGFKDSIENGAGFEDLNKRYVSLCFLVIWTKSERTATFFFVKPSLRNDQLFGFRVLNDEETSSLFYPS